jgi:hypothetical protein
VVRDVDADPPSRRKIHAQAVPSDLPYRDFGGISRIQDEIHHGRKFRDR